MDEVQASQLPTPCGNYAYVGYPTNQCSTRYEYDQPRHTFGGYYEQPRHDPYYNTYGYAEANDYQDYQGYQAQPTPPSSDPAISELAKTLQMMQQQMDQMATSLNAIMLRREEEL
ncbi:uncharacterized protein LOC122724329 [Manihot esculenta]|uniref:uncharacterized protein LOC122724329 n=1 Tax=Manihot esculenta TaxID=3983 RepID=UPI001CC7AAFC|nr:uncharacterized protein LOC122724329 [Manihot esculenta]